LGILRRTTSDMEITIEKIAGAKAVIRMRQLVRRVPIAEHVERYIIRLIRATHPDTPDAPEMIKRYVELGAGIRGVQAITLTAKIKALLDGRYNVAFADVCSVALPALRHRILLNFEGEGEGIKTDEIIKHVLECVPEM
ncbi:MAG: AAA family ATPase, partial [Candidatus Poribacteria bacterium]